MPEKNKKAVWQTEKITRTILFIMLIICFGTQVYMRTETRTNMQLLENNMREKLMKEMRSVMSREIKLRLAHMRPGRPGNTRHAAFVTAAMPKNMYERMDNDQPVRQDNIASNEELELCAAMGSQEETALGNGLTKKKNAQAGVSQADKGKDTSHTEKGVQDVTAGGAKSRPVELTLEQQGSVLLAKGRLQIEPEFAAGHFSSNRVNIDGFSIMDILIIGEISTEKIQRDILIGGASFKYGILRNLQGELRIPYRYEYDRISNNTNGKETVRSAEGLGDIDFGFSSQIWSEHGIVPDLVANFSCKTPTGQDPYNNAIGLGTGHWGLKGSLIAAKSSDPAVVFSNLSYTWNIKRKVDDHWGTIDPGDTISFGIGAAIALSYQTAINFQYSQDITSKMEKDGYQVSGSFVNSASLKTGFTWSINEKASVNFSASMGMTTDAPDYLVQVSMPVVF